MYDYVIKPIFEGTRMEIPSIILLFVSLLTIGAIVLTQDNAHSPLSYLILLPSENAMVIDLLMCIALVTVIYYALATRNSSFFLPVGV